MEPVRTSFNCFYCEGELYLSYPTLPEGEDSDAQFEALFDGYNAYSAVHTLFLDTDFYYSLPPCLLKFTALRRLTVVGTRWWGLTCEHIPPTVEVLMLRSGNLQTCFAHGLERLTALKELSVPLDVLFDVDYETMNSGTEDDLQRTLAPKEWEGVPLPYLPSLRLLADAGYDYYQPNNILTHLALAAYTSVAVRREVIDRDSYDVFYLN